MPSPSREGAVIAAETGVRLSVHDDLRAIELEWRLFEQQAEHTPFQAFDWIAAWQRHIGMRQGVRPAVVFGRNTRAELLFILPLAVAARSPVVRRLIWLGADLSDYNAPILAGDFSRRIDRSQFALVWREAIALIRDTPRLRFDLVDLRKMPEWIGAERNPFLDFSVVPNPSGAHVATLEPDWEKFYAKRSPATRRRDRTKLRRLADHGEVRFVEPESVDDIRRTVQVLFEQKARALARMGIPDLFARPGYREFFLDIAADPVLRNLVHVSRLEVGSTIAAANLGLTSRGCYYYLLASYQDGELGRFGPGAVHLRELLRHAIEHGFRCFDFTIGDEGYKRDWCDAELQLYDHLAAVSVRAVPVLALDTAHSRLKRLIKQNALLWRAFSKARSTVGWFSSRALRSELVRGA